MIAGDFLECYSGDKCKEVFDAIVTVFFIDTAPNILSYLEVISNVLKKGSIWINHGPLLWHFENSSNIYADNYGFKGSIELTLEDIIELLPKYGFEIIEQHATDTTYMGNQRSMLRHQYEPEFWVAKKI